MRDILIHSFTYLKNEIIPIKYYSNISNNTIF